MEHRLVAERYYIYTYIYRKMSSHYAYLLKPKNNVCLEFTRGFVSKNKTASTEILDIF
jgi:hypothetical protein